MQDLYLYREQGIAAGQEPDDEVGGFRLNPLVFLAAHIPLALLMSQFPFVSTIHAAATFIVSLWFAAMGRRVEQVAYAGAYIVGAEVLWRMTGAQTFWEFGKYAVVALFIISMARRSRLQGPLLPFLYFALLLPSCVLTLMSESLGEARQQISFNLSGPLALMVSALFFSHVKLDAERLQWLRLALIAPIISIATIAIYATLTNPDIIFTGESNNATSGGYGPNQVSAALGLGAMLVLFFVLEAYTSRLMRFMLFAVMIALATQSALTFSRGGLYNAVGGAVLGFAFLARDLRSSFKFILLAVVLFTVATYVVLPRLDDFTGGAITERFDSVDPTNRDHIVEADLQIWREHPVFGVGPGQGPIFRRAILYGAVSHTEFTRLIAEHGLLGLASMALLLLSGARGLKKTRGAKGRAVKASCIGWSLLYMLNAAMRLAAPSLLFGLAFANLDFEERATPDD